VKIRNDLRRAPERRPRWSALEEEHAQERHHATTFGRGGSRSTGRAGIPRPGRSWGGIRGGEGRQARPAPRTAQLGPPVRRGGFIYYERWFDGERVKFSTRSTDWHQAAAVRDLYEVRRAARRTPGKADPPRFVEMAARYVREAAGHLAGSTQEDRERMLGPAGPLTRYFGARRLDEVTRASLLEWWHLEVEGRGRSERTGLTYLSALSAVFGYAVDLELLAGNPVDALRGTLRRRRRSKQGRAEAEVERIHPLETPEELRAFTSGSRAAYLGRLRNGRALRQRQAGHVADLLQLDAGLRLGEAAGLRWRDVVWGDGPSDTRRCLVVREAIARGKHAGAPKSGRTRKVALSRRLQVLLREFYIASGRPGAGERVLAGFHQRNYQARHFEDVRHTPKDLRDAFASQLLTAGVQLGYISAQLGHADVATTARHYARWEGGDAYRRPVDLEPGEIPADVLDRIEGAEQERSELYGRG